MKRLAAFWLAWALLMGGGSGWAASAIRVDTAAAREVVWVARSSVRQARERTATAAPLHRTIRFRIPAAPSFARVVRLAFALFQRPPTFLVFSFTR